MVMREHLKNGKYKYLNWPWYNWIMTGTAVLFGQHGTLFIPEYLFKSLVKCFDDFYEDLFIKVGLKMKTKY